ncbi:MAG: carbohydrate ABC transporter permease [Saccharofermentanales bacterium]
MSMEKVLTQKRKPFRISQIFIHLGLLFLVVLCVMPLLAIIAISVSNENDLVKYGFELIPRTIDFLGYTYIFNDMTSLLNAYKITTMTTVIGTLFSLFISAGVAYVISRPDYRFKSIMSFYIFFTMLFSGGLIPWYMLIENYLNLGDTLFALILPYTVGVWNVLLLRTFFQKLPFDIIESCYIDGANEFRIFFRIVLPLSTPGLATVALFISLTYWNDYWLGLLFIEKQHMTPLQLLLYNLMSNIEYLKMHGSMPGNIKLSEIPFQSARMSMALLAAGPMLFVFPFFQKYFVKGLTVGSIKG